MTKPPIYLSTTFCFAPPPHPLDCRILRCEKWYLIISEYISFWLEMILSTDIVMIMLSAFRRIECRVYIFRLYDTPGKNLVISSNKFLSVMFRRLLLSIFWFHEFIWDCITKCNIFQSNYSQSFIFRIFIIDGPFHPSKTERLFHSPNLCSMCHDRWSILGVILDKQKWRSRPCGCWWVYISLI